jgi:hypothetical protein
VIGVGLTPSLRLAAGDLVRGRLCAVPWWLLVQRVEEQAEALAHGGMGQHRVADLLVAQAAEHGELQRGDDLSGVALGSKTRL